MPSTDPYYPFRFLVFLKQPQMGSHLGIPWARNMRSYRQPCS